MNKSLLTFIITLLAILFCYMFYRIDKKHCENNGGVYIWEWTSNGNQCHYKGGK